MPDPIDMDDDIQVGVTLPLQSGQQGFFDQSNTTLEAAKSNVKNLLLTMKGERPMQPEFGSDLFSVLFEPIVEGGEIEEKCTIAIEEAVKIWLPYLNIDSIDITGTDEDTDRNIYRISLVFSIKADPDRFDELTFNLEGGTTG
jgi:phage baseplate assembly protein W